jgi:hypothetical protein
VRWLAPIIPALKRLRQEDHKFEATLGYIASFTSVSKTKQNNNNNKNKISNLSL